MKGFANGLRATFIRELRSYAATPLAPVFVAVFLVAAGAFAFQIGGIFETGRADLTPFFQFHPWLHLIFAPALAMRLWADETRTGTLETLLTLPVPVTSLVLGKFLAAWLVVGVALVLTFPLWLAFSLLGPVDHGATLVAYVGSFLVAGGFIAVGSAFSALSASPVVAFVISVAVCFAFTTAGLPVVGDVARSLFAPAGADVLARVAVLDQAEGFQRGVVEAKALVFFVSFTGLWLALTGLAIEARRSPA